MFRVANDADYPSVQITSNAVLKTLKETSAALENIFTPEEKQHDTSYQTAKNTIAIVSEKWDCHESKIDKTPQNIFQTICRLLSLIEIVSNKLSHTTLKKKEVAKTLGHCWGPLRSHGQTANISKTSIELFQLLMERKLLRQDLISLILKTQPLRHINELASRVSTLKKLIDALRTINQTHHEEVIAIYAQILKHHNICGWEECDIAQLSGNWATIENQLERVSNDVQYNERLGQLSNDVKEGIVLLIRKAILIERLFESSQERKVTTKRTHVEAALEVAVPSGVLTTEYLLMCNEALLTVEVFQIYVRILLNANQRISWASVVPHTPEYREVLEALVKINSLNEKTLAIVDMIANKLIGMRGHAVVVVQALAGLFSSAEKTSQFIGKFSLLVDDRTRLNFIVCYSMLYLALSDSSAWFNTFINNWDDIKTLPEVQNHGVKALYGSSAGKYGFECNVQILQILVKVCCPRLTSSWTWKRAHTLLHWWWTSGEEIVKRPLKHLVAHILQVNDEGFDKRVHDFMDEEGTYKQLGDKEYFLTNYVEIACAAFKEPALFDGLFRLIEAELPTYRDRMAICRRMVATLLRSAEPLTGHKHAYLAKGLRALHERYREVIQVGEVGVARTDTLKICVDHLLMFYDKKQTVEDNLATFGNYFMANEQRLFGDIAPEREQAALVPAPAVAPIHPQQNRGGFNTHAQIINRSTSITLVKLHKRYGSQGITNKMKQTFDHMRTQLLACRDALLDQEMTAFTESFATLSLEGQREVKQRKREKMVEITKKYDRAERFLFQQIAKSTYKDPLTQYGMPYILYLIWSALVDLSPDVHHSPEPLTARERFDHMTQFFDNCARSLRFYNRSLDGTDIGDLDHHAALPPMQPNEQQLIETARDLSPCERLLRFTLDLSRCGDGDVHELLSGLNMVHKDVTLIFDTHQWLLDQLKSRLVQAAFDFQVAHGFSVSIEEWVKQQIEEMEGVAVEMTSATRLACVAFLDQFKAQPMKDNEGMKLLVLSDEQYQGYIANIDNLTFDMEKYQSLCREHQALSSASVSSSLASSSSSTTTNNSLGFSHSNGLWAPAPETRSPDVGHKRDREVARLN